MIPYIDTQLNLWSAWLASGREHLGYPRQAAFLDGLGGSGTGMKISDARGGDIDRAVNALVPEQKQAVRLVYLSMRNHPVEAIAKHLQCHRDTLYARLHRAHVCIMEALQMQERDR